MLRGMLADARAFRARGGGALGTRRSSATKVESRWQQLRIVLWEGIVAGAGGHEDLLRCGPRARAVDSRGRVRESRGAIAGCSCAAVFYVPNARVARGRLPDRIRPLRRQGGHPRFHVEIC